MLGQVARTVSGAEAEQGVWSDTLTDPLKFSAGDMGCPAFHTSAAHWEGALQEGRSTGRENRSYCKDFHTRRTVGRTSDLKKRD